MFGTPWETRETALRSYLLFSPSHYELQEKYGQVSPRFAIRSVAHGASCGSIGIFFLTNPLPWSFSAPLTILGKVCAPMVTSNYVNFYFLLDFYFSQHIAIVQLKLSA